MDIQRSSAEAVSAGAVASTYEMSEENRKTPSTV